MKITVEIPADIGVEDLTEWYVGSNSIMAVAVLYSTSGVENVIVGTEVYPDP